MTTIMTESLRASLGDYDHIGFTLDHVGDDYREFLELKFQGKHVGFFNPLKIKKAGIREACQEYLRRNEFGRGG